MDESVISSQAPVDEQFGSGLVKWMNKVQEV
jgi:hypothetical protein